MVHEGYRSIAIRDEAYERHKRRKEELGVTWTEYLDGQAPDIGAVDFDADEISETVHSAMTEAYQEYVGEIEQLSYEGAREAVQEAQVHR